MHYTIKFALGFVVIVGLWFGGKWLYASWSLRETRLDPIAPGEVNLIGIDTGKGYHVVVANRAAQLVLGRRGSFSAPDDPTADEGEKRRVPIREMLQSLQGNEKALSRFVMVLNNFTDEEFPPNPKVWKAEDLKKAFSGDTALRTKLEQDLNVKLDGTPLQEARPRSLSDGIVIDLPVPIKIKSGFLGGKSAAETTLIARVQEQFQSSFARAVYSHYREKEPTAQMIAGYYAQEAQELVDHPQLKQDVRSAINDRLNERRLLSYAEFPEQVLNSIFVIVNDSHITGASLKKVQSATGHESFDLEMNLTDDGRKRLWKYSRENANAQLLLVSNGVAVAAPLINGELPRTEVTIAQLSDEGLARNTVETLEQLAKEKRG